jgi:excisionase family DNA binding protein
MTTDTASSSPPAADRLARLDPLTYSVAELARALGCSERHVWRQHAAGELPTAVRIGRLVRWPRKTIDRWLADGCPAVPVKPSR